MTIVPVQIQSDLGFQVPDDALVLSIKSQLMAYFSYPGFLLYNTHSLPIRSEDIQITFAEKSGPLLMWTIETYRGRFPGPTEPYTGGNTTDSDTFSITYIEPTSNGPLTDFANTILGISAIPRFVESQWTTAYPSPEYAWDVPFLYEDRRYLFYVTTTENLVPFGGVNGFGWSLTTSDLSTIAPRIPVLEISGTATPGGVADGRSLSVSGSNIRIALDTTTVITYQGQEIGPAGRIGNGTPTTRVTNGRTRA
jgi:hypothetical protein